MPITINGSTGVAGIDGSAGTPSVQGNDTNTGVFFPAADTVALSTGGTERMRINSVGDVSIGTSSADGRFLLERQAATAGWLVNAKSAGVTNSSGIYVDASNNMEFAARDGSGALNLRLGSTGSSWFTGGWVGVGTASPSSTLHVRGASGSSAYILAEHPGNTSFGTAIQVRTYAGSDDPAISIENYNSGSPVRYSMSVFDDGALSFNSGGYIGGFGTSQLRLTSAGLIQTSNGIELGDLASGDRYVLIDFHSSGNPLTVDYNARVARTAGFNGDLVLLNVGTGRVFVQANTNGVQLTNGSTAWASASDERLKTDLVEIDDALNKVSQLRSVTGRYKTDEEGTSRSFLIAQDVRAVLPEAVSEDNDEDKTLNIRYTEVIPLLTAALKEASQKIDALEARIAALETP